MENGIDLDSPRVAQSMRGGTIIIAIALIIYWVALFYGTHSPLPPGMLPGHSDKIIHFVAYGGLAALLMSLRASRGPFPWTSIVARWLFLAFYGAFDEITQALVNRSPDLEDWYADLLGAAVGLGFVIFAFRLIRGNSKTSTVNLPEVVTQ